MGEPRSHPRKLCKVEICFDRASGELLAKGARAEEYYAHNHDRAKDDGRPICFLAFDGDEVYGFSGRGLLASAGVRQEFSLQYPKLHKAFVASQEKEATYKAGYMGRKLARRARRG